MKRSYRRNSIGQALIEYALLLPIFLLIVTVIFDLGRATYYYSAIHNSAREGARYGIVFPDDTTGIETAVRNFAVGLAQSDLTVSSVLPDEDTIQVTVTFQFRAATPFVPIFLGSNQVTLRSRSTMQIER